MILKNKCIKKIMITGCAGFIGSHLTEFYLKKGFRVIGYDNFLTGSECNISEFFNNKNFEFYEKDICKKIEFNHNVDFILHFASPASPMDYLRFPIQTLKIGAFGTFNILKLAKKINATVLVASTSEVYGDPLVHPQNEEYYGNVNSVGPRGVYDEAKRYLEALTMAFNKKYQLNTKIARIFNTYGPRMRKEDGRAIPTFLNQSINGNDFTVFGDGKQTRSFCYIDDLVSGIDKLLFSNYNYPVNLGNPTEITILKLIDHINEIQHSKTNIIYCDLPENDPKVRQPDISLAKNILKWEPKVILKEGLIKTLDFYKKQ